MCISALARRRYRVEIRLLLNVTMLVVVIFVFQCFAFSAWRTFSLLHAHWHSIKPPVDDEVAIPATVLPNVTHASSSKEDAFEKEADMDFELESDGDRNSRKEFEESFKVENLENAIYNFTQKRRKYAHGLIEQTREIDNINKIPFSPEAHNNLESGKTQGQANNMQFGSQGVPSKSIKIMNADLTTSNLLITTNISSKGNGMQSMGLQPKNEKTELLKTTLPILKNKSKIGTLSTRSKLVQPTSMTQMDSLLLQSYNSSPSMRPRGYSPRDRELLSAKLEIENAPVIPNASDLYAPVFRDVSKFIRSYELMESKLKVYVYKEGEKPIFHQPKMRGLYASEGWFMKLMEANKNFIVRDPRRAHLFYLPFSTQMLRVTLSGQNLGKQMEQYLERYVELIAGKYRFWNRTGGADHFLVACHDWASRVTRKLMENCIRSLCNANVAKGFKIGKDTSLPVTYIHSMMDPLRGTEESTPSERPILAFFAGGMHGYLRPILLKYWENKEPDMKIFGPMPRDAEGKRIYKKYMKSSKYCICARGYEVFSPRIVEAILSECVPVIISDNYVLPFFEVLNWEAFSVFVRERDIPHLRNLLLSVPEEKFLALQLGVMKVKKHFLWHRSPVKYDLFHMILHSVWYNRVFQIRPR